MQISRLSDKRLHRFEFNFYKSLRLFLILCQCCGAAPIRLSFCNFSSSSVTAKRSYRDLFMSLVHYACWTLALCSIISATYFQFKEFDSENVMFLTRIFYFGEYISGVTNATLIFIGCQYQRNRYGEYFRHFSQMFLRLATFGVAVDIVSTKKFLKRLLFAYLAFFGLVFFVAFELNEFDLKAFLRVNTVYTIPNIIAAMALAEYFLLLDLLTQCYAKIGIILTEFINGNGCCAHNQTNIFQRELNHIQKLVIRSGCMSDGQKIEQLRLMYLELNQLHHEINASFGLLIISTMVSTFIVMSIQFYTFYTIIEGYSNKNAWLTVITFLWVILHGGKIFLILLFNQFVSDEVRIICFCNRNQLNQQKIQQKKSLGRTLYRINTDTEQMCCSPALRKNIGFYVIVLHLLANELSSK